MCGSYYCAAQMTSVFPALFIIRFFALSGHAIAMALLYQSVPVMARSGLALGATSNGIALREQHLNWFISVSLVCLAGDAFMGILGVTLGKPRVTLAHGIFHGLGCFFTLWSAVDAWTWQSIAVIFCLFVAPPFTMEVLLARPVGPAINFLKKGLQLGRCCAAVAMCCAKTVCVEGFYFCFPWRRGERRPASGV